MTHTPSHPSIKRICCLMAACAFSCIYLPAQSIRIHKTDGTMQKWRQSEIDSIIYEEIPHYDTPQNQAANLTLEIRTDSACYHPGSTVKFTHNGSSFLRAKVRYMHLGKVLHEEDLTSSQWTWKTPPEDFKGYMVQIYQTSTTGETVRGTIAVDVSSDWRKFPRYGFVADFGSSKTASVTATEMDWLNRCHINGVQFQDWHYKHHWPWGGTKNGETLDSYTDIANRTVYTSSVENYIKAQHDRGMKSIFYNLCYGALSDAVQDGVSATCFLYKNAEHTVRDCHQLPSSWKSDIYVVNPSLTAWTTYMKVRIAEVYNHLDFDGFQIDQLGYRGKLYSNTGQEVNILTTFAPFIRAIKTKFPDKRLIMNAVGSYGTKEIAGTKKMDFLYNEVWDGEKNFADLYKILENNKALGGDTLQTVFAAYMNYNLDNTNFNLPGVILTDAVMFALGGSHLELGGDHMLCREYFPYASVSMSEALKKRIVTYYDFMTAYENLLRDGGTLNTSTSLVPKDTSGKISINGWEPQLGGVTTIAREKEDCTVLHFLNFINANSLSWRDMDGTMPAANTNTNIPLEMTYAKPVKHLYVATPDKLGGAMNELEFTQEGSTLNFTLPYLNYWTMVVIQE